MMRQTLKPIAAPAVLLLLLALTGCTEVRFISPYDEPTEQAVVALHRQVETLLLDLERGAGTAEAEYERHRPRYERLLLDLRTLRLRASARPQNEIQAEQLGEIERQLALMEEAHREGLTAADIVLFRQGFEASFLAVLTLELAKKRGT